jgi:NAD(P)H-binding
LLLSLAQDHAPVTARHHAGRTVGISLSSATLITIYGGSGFIGRHVVRALAKTGARMRVAVRRPELAGFLQPLGGVGQITAVQANVRYPDSLLALARGADAVINLVGILAPSGRQTFKSVQDEGARHVAEAVCSAATRGFLSLLCICRRLGPMPTRLRSMPAPNLPARLR